MRAAFLLAESCAENRRLCAPALRIRAGIRRRRAALPAAARGRAHLCRSAELYQIAPPLHGIFFTQPTEKSINLSYYLL